MHPPLFKPHPLCAEFVDALVECHKNNPYKKYIGACNEVKAGLDKCFKIEKEQRRERNKRLADIEKKQFEESQQARRRSGDEHTGSAAL